MSVPSGNLIKSDPLEGAGLRTRGIKEALVHLQAP